MNTDFDKGRVYYADMKSSLNTTQKDGSSAQAKAEAAKSKFRSFLENFTIDNVFFYREELKRSTQMGHFCLKINLEHLVHYDEDLSNALQSHPMEMVEAFENATQELVRVIFNEENLQIPNSGIQIQLFSSSLEPMPLRELESSRIGKLVRISGIVITASSPIAKPINLTVVCKSCLAMRSIVLNGFTNPILPRTCPATGSCPLDPWMVIPERSTCVDQQSLKLQELPESVPVGELPRHVLLIADRYHTAIAAPGKRFLVTGIYSLMAPNSGKGGMGVALRFPYLRVLGLEPLVMADMPRPALSLTSVQERRFLDFSRIPKVYERISQSIAPSLYGHEDIKKSIACLLFGGTPKYLPDKMRLRGDINVLLLGDPGTAKSQLLKVVERIAPIAVYTSGKGSSAAGLTASVIRDPSSGEFYLEGGAMVLADGGVVCIDEFDKMRDEDRVAIHEAMEQQTISIAKAGITTILNSRASVLAAANPVFGRYDEFRSPGENIDFSSTILSRFDMIFIVKDEHSIDKDTTLAKHVVGVHMNATRQGKDQLMMMDIVDPDSTSMEDNFTVDPDFLRAYISFCRGQCHPHLSKAACARLSDFYVRMRSEVHELEIACDQRSSIPITIRQLEAIIRIAESLAKMQLCSNATEEHVDEAIRLFRVSTMNAIHSGHTVEGSIRPELINEIEKIERSIKQRLPLGSSIEYKRLLSELVTVKKFNEACSLRAIETLVAQEKLLFRGQRRILVRQHL